MNKTISKKEKQIIHFVHFYSHPGGIEVILPIIINAMPEWIFECFVIRNPDPEEVNIYNSTNIKVEYGSKSNFMAFIKILLYAQRNRNHIFQAFNIGPLFLIALHLAGIKKLIYSIHGTVYWKADWQKHLRKYLWHIALKSNIEITSNTAFSKKVFLEKICQAAEIQVIYNPISRDRYSPPSNERKSEFLRIIYVGRLNRGKNLEKWIDLASQIHRSIPGTNFEIYGSGPLIDRLQDKIDLQNINSFVFLKGFTDDVVKVYRNADILLFLSEYESFGNVAVESILCGTPVIVSDIPSMREIFRDYPEFLIKLDNNIFENVLHKLSEIDKLRELTKKARDQFLNRFSVEAHVTALERLYKSFNN